MTGIDWFSIAMQGIPLGASCFAEDSYRSVRRIRGGDQLHLKVSNDQASSG